MSTNQSRIKVNQDRTKIWEYCVGDRVIAIFRKYGVHKFEAEITEVCENTHGLEGVWISVDRIRVLDPTDEIAVRKVEMKIRMMVPLKDIRDLRN